MRTLTMFTVLGIMTFTMFSNTIMSSIDGQGLNIICQSIFNHFYFVVIFVGTVSRSIRHPIILQNKVS